MHKTVYSLRNYKKQLILGPIFKTLEVVFELLIPFLMKNIIDNGINEAKLNGNYNTILVDGGIILLFCVLGYFSTMMCQYLSSIASQGFGTDLRNRLFKKINDLSLKEINDFGPGFVSNLFNNDANRLQLAVAMIIRLVIRAPALVIGSLVCSLFISWQIALIYLGIVVIVSLFLFIILKSTSHKFLKLQHQNDELSQIVDDGINGTRVIRSFNSQEIEVKKYEEKTDEYYKDAKKVSLLNALINPTTYLVINIGILLTIYIGSLFINNKNESSFSVGDIVALVSYLSQILTALVVVCNLVVIFNKAYASKKRVDGFFLTESSVKNNAMYKNLKIEKNRTLFDFKDVDFSYANNINVVSNLNLTIKKGESVGIIGGTGSGKSTIVKLLDRFIDCTHGTISYKGVDLKLYDLDELHKEISLVNQKNQVFKGTIRSNLLVANNHATKEDLINALKNAEAYSFVSKYDDFLDHPVEEGGHNLSGGQIQRLCIARALLRNSETIILDDSMSSLDFITDKKVRQNLAKLTNLTKIYVSQRATTLKHCNKIIVVDKGKIECVGNHDYLLENSPIYKEIYESQVRNN
jgi:ATP-binding cassette subfamily B protein